MKAAVPLLILAMILIFALVAHAGEDNGCGGGAGRPPPTALAL